MAEECECWQCPGCGTRVDISSLGFYAEVTCPQCGGTGHVHTTLANFELEGLLGIGGMSVVLRGRDVLLNRPVAIKLLNETYRNQPERIARFEKECAMMAKVHHENVVSVYSAGWANNEFYIAMELLDGRNLESVATKDHPLRPLTAIDVVTRIARGLEAAHKSGLLHRDMKPGNVIITKDSVVKVLDFGLAQRSTDEDSEEVIWATPFYVAPETLMREAEDARTDMYSLGMTLRYLLTGEDTLAETPTSISSLLEAKAALPPFAKSMPRAHSALCELVDRMTAFDPSQRHENYADLLAELGEVRDALSQRERRLFSPAGLNTPSSKRLSAYAGIGIAAILAFAGAYFLGKPAAQKSAVVVPMDRKSGFDAKAVDNLESYLKSDCVKAQSKKNLKLVEQWRSSEPEPCIAAMGLIHAACVAYSERKDPAIYLPSFHQAVSRMAEVKDAASLQHQLRALSAAIRSAEKGDSEPVVLKLAESEHRLRGLFYCISAYYQESNENNAAAEVSMKQAVQEFALAGDAALYASLRKRFEKFEFQSEPDTELPPVDEVIPVADGDSDAGILLKAMQCDMVHQSAEALGYLSSLKGEQTDAMVSAIAMLHAACIVQLQRQLPDEYLKEFFAAVQRMPENAESQDVLDDLRRVSAALTEPESAEAVKDPRFNALLHCLLVRTHLKNGDVSACKKSLAVAEKAFAKVKDISPYASMLELLKESSAPLVAVVDTAARQQVPELMAEHNFNAAVEAIDVALQSEPTNREELLVQKEICECAAALDVTLKRVMKGDFSKKMTAAALKKKNAEKSYFPEERVAEFCVILYLVKGDYEKAFKANPYKDDASSDAPFAVMVRDWQSRLEAAKSASVDVED